MATALRTRGLGREIPSRVAVNRSVVVSFPIKTRQLFVYGEPSTQRTLLIRMLEQARRVYTTGERKSDYSGADSFHDLWVLDEFQDHVAEKTLFEEKPGVYLNHLLKLLDGQTCRLDAKYERVFLKKRNVPIILMSKELPYLFRKTGPWSERIFPLKFLSHLKRIQEERIVATAEWGWCIRKRAAIRQAQGFPPMDNNFFQVQEFYLQEKDYINMETYHVIGLAQMFLPNDEISPPEGYGKERKRTPFTSRLRVLERCQLNLLACALIPVPRRPGPGGRKLKKNPPIQRREGGSKNIEGIESNGLYL